MRPDTIDKAFDETSRQRPHERLADGSVSDDPSEDGKAWFVDGAASLKSHPHEVALSEVSSLEIYDPADLRAAIRDLVGDKDLLDDEISWSNELEDVLANEDRMRLKRLRILAADRRGSRRKLIAATSAMVEAIARLEHTASHFAPFLKLVERAIHLAMATNQPMRLPPTLLLGAPGIGKTWLLKQVAAIIGTGFHLFPMNMLDAFRLRGLNTSWKAARMGRIAEVLLGSDSASPVILLDEFDKAPVLDRVERPYDIWHSLLEEENSRSFTDDYLEIPLRCDHVIWIASANSTETLPESILDRVLVLRIPSPDLRQRLVIVDGLYRTARGHYGNCFAEHLCDQVRTLLARHNPRRAGRILQLALGFMAADDRKAMTGSDVDRASRLIDDNWQMGTFNHPVGFMPDLGKTVC